MIKQLLKTLGVMAVLLSLVAVPALAKENGPIVFSDGQTDQITKVDPATGVVTPLYAKGRYPTVAPDEKTLIFVRYEPINDTVSTYRLYKAPLDGSAEPALIPTTNADPADTTYEVIENPTVSPDGQTIYFRYMRVGPDNGHGTVREYGLASLPINGGSITVIPVDVVGEGAFEGLSVTPDGENLVWADSGHIQTASVSGGTVHTLMQREFISDTCDTTYMSPTISPDGQTVAATRWHVEPCEEGNPEDIESSIVTVPFSTTNTETPETVPGTQSSNFVTQVSYPAFSPNGQLLSFNKRSSDGKRAILSVPVAGGSPSVIMPYSSIEPLWNEWAPSPADTTPPKVDVVTPADGAQGVGRGSTVTAEFSEKVKAATLTSNVQLFSGNSTRPIKAALSVDPPTDEPTSVTLTPSSKLDAKTTYKVVVGTGVKDLADNPLDQDQDPSNGNQSKQWTFTTAAR